MSTVIMLLSATITAASHLSLEPCGDMGACEVLGVAEVELLGHFRLARRVSTWKERTQVRTGTLGAQANAARRLVTD